MGYTNNGVRGDFLSLPVLTGIAGVTDSFAIIETSFHKGITVIDAVSFPRTEANAALYDAAFALLEAEETR